MRSSRRTGMSLFQGEPARRLRNKSALEVEKQIAIPVLLVQGISIGALRAAGVGETHVGGAQVFDVPVGEALVAAMDVPVGEDVIVVHIGDKGAAVIGILLFDDEDLLARVDD